MSVNCEENAQISFEEKEVSETETLQRDCHIEIASCFVVVFCVRDVNNNNFDGERTQIYLFYDEVSCSKEANVSFMMKKFPSQG